jgi:hypothetical protein
LFKTTLGAVLGTSTLHLLLAIGLSRFHGLLVAGRGGGGSGSYGPGGDFLDTRSAGFSGVLFHYVVVEVSAASGSGDNSRSLFGIASIPPRWYPWAL